MKALIFLVSIIMIIDISFAANKDEEKENTIPCKKILAFKEYCISKRDTEVIQNQINLENRVSKRSGSKSRKIQNLTRLVIRLEDQTTVKEKEYKDIKVSGPEPKECIISEGSGFLQPQLTQETKEKLNSLLKSQCSITEDDLTY